MNTLLDNIKETPQILLNILQKDNHEIDDIVSFLKVRKIEEVILVGSGTSYHAGLFVEKTFNEQTDIAFKSYYPYEVIESNKIYHDKQLVIGLSQSGMSASTHAALTKARQQGVSTALISSNQTSRLQEVSDYFIFLDCGEEKAVAKTKGFNASCVLLYRLALELSPNKDQLMTELVSVINRLPKTIAQSEKWMLKNEENFKRADHLYVIAPANHIGLLKEATLKFIETIRIPVVGYELEEFMHGIYNAITDQSFILFMNSSSKYSERMLQLYAYLTKKTDDCYLMDEDGRNDTRNLELKPRGNEDFDALHYTLATQVMCHYGALAKGIDPTISGDVYFHPAMKSKVN